MKIKKFRISLYCVILPVFATLIIFSLLSAEAYKYNNINRIVQFTTQQTNLIKAFIDGATYALQGDNIDKTIMRIGYISLSKDASLTYTNPTYGIK